MPALLKVTLVESGANNTAEKADAVQISSRITDT